MTAVEADIIKDLELKESQMPILAGSFGLTEDGRPTLVGVRCLDCGRVSFPRHGGCPRCHSTGLVSQPLGQSGRLVNFTVAHVAPAGFQAPYVLGEVQLDEGPLLLSQLAVTPAEAEWLQPGMRVHLQLRILGLNEQNLEIVGWSYAPPRTTRGGRE